MRLLVACILVAGICLSVLEAGAADDPYTVSGIKVDATAQSRVVAQTMAINSGRDRAWQTLYRRLAKQQDWARQPALDPVTLQRLIRSYEARDQRSSTTRFVASMTYVFNPGAVRHILQQANLAYSDVTARPILVIPLGPTYDVRSPWTHAWGNPHVAQGGVPLILPQADAIDAAALAALKFDSASWQDVEPIASRLHAPEAYLALALPTAKQIVVKIRRLGPGTVPPIPDVVTPVPPKTPTDKAYASVADATATTIADAWKARTAVDFSKRAKVVASLHADSIEDWGQTLQKLGAISTITDVSVVAMDIGEARVAISYVGSQDQLNEQLAHVGLSLANEDGQWWLARGSSNPTSR